MKKIIAAVFMVALCVISCNKANVETESSDDYVQISLGLIGEVPTITTSPMTRAGEAKDWYQIQVYSAPKGTTDYKYYGYGFFDNVDNMLINLKKGYQYMFEVDMIVDGSEKINHFSLVNSGWADITNSFYLSFDEHIRYLGNGYLYMSRPYDTFNRPDVDRFYGIAEGYVPRSNGKVSVDMKRVAFGVKFVANDFEVGELEIQIDQAPGMKMISGEGNTAESVISFYNTAAAYADKDYTENIAVNIILAKEDGVRIPLVSQEVPFMRNRITTIEFNAQEPSQNNTFKITANEEWETGDTIYLEGSDQE